MLRWTLVRKDPVADEHLLLYSNDRTVCFSVGPITASVPLALPTDSGNMASSKVTAGMFPHLHLVTPAQWQTIIEGKYTNLASLLVPPSDNHDIREIEADGTVEILMLIGFRECHY
jgi:hypothetical protein